MQNRIGGCAQFDCGRFKDLCVWFVASQFAGYDNGVKILLQLQSAEQGPQTLVPIGNNAQLQAALLEPLQARQHVLKHPPRRGGGKMAVEIGE